MLDEFIARHRLPDAFRHVIAGHYAPLVTWLAEQRRDAAPLLLGINGAQGTGKSTLADFIRIAIEAQRGWHVAVLSLDDFYLTKADRERLADSTHPLLRTRGVPGTHDLGMLNNYLARLRALGDGRELALPRFDKATDDRAEPSEWPSVAGPVDLIVLEGWCVGSRPQEHADLIEPINALEREQDDSGTWRHYVNRQLEGPYADVFAELDLLVVLQAPSFGAVYRWRLEQEQKLAAATMGTAIMSDEQVARFIQYFERITRANLEQLPALADAVLELDDAHDCVRSRCRP